jgi:hypothetical protein
MLWLRQSEAFAKSQKMPPTCIAWLRDFNTLSVGLKVAYDSWTYCNSHQISVYSLCVI